MLLTGFAPGRNRLGKARPRTKRLRRATVDETVGMTRSFRPEAPDPQQICHPEQATCLRQVKGGHEHTGIRIASWLTRPRSMGAPHLARFSRDVGLPQSFWLSAVVDPYLAKNKRDMGHPSFVAERLFIRTGA